MKLVRGLIIQILLIWLISSLIFLFYLSLGLTSVSPVTLRPLTGSALFRSELGFYLFILELVGLIWLQIYIIIKHKYIYEALSGYLPEKWLNLIIHASLILALLFGSLGLILRTSIFSYFVFYIILIIIPAAVKRTQEKNLVKKQPTARL